MLSVYRDTLLLLLDDDAISLRRCQQKPPPFEVSFSLAQLVEFLFKREHSSSALLVIVFFLVLSLSPLIKSNYPKTTPSHSEPTNQKSQKNSDRIPQEFTKNSQIRTSNHTSPKNSQRIHKEFTKNFQRISKEFPKNF
jgi:hypothetical protein